jgi:hypothetical protein
MFIEVAQQAADRTGRDDGVRVQQDRAAERRIAADRMAQTGVVAVREAAVARHREHFSPAVPGVPVDGRIDLRR